MRYIVNVSSGLSSYEALRRTLERYGHANTEAVFADVKGDSTNPYDGEDEDNYRFLADIERHLGITITRLNQHKTVWDVYRKERAFMLVNGLTRFAPCSKVLKREPLDAYVEERYQPDECVIVVGMKWSELARMEKLERAKAPYRVWFPLAEAPYVDDCHIQAELERAGIAVPRMYLEGFEHANCGRWCVHAGQAHYALLWRTDPDRYRYYEAREQEISDHLGKKVTILRDRRGGANVPTSLREFRERLEAGDDYDRQAWGGCGCFAQTVQTRMDDLLLETEVNV